MPSRKQKRREAKAKRHEYEFVYVDEEGNELDEAPDELLEPKERRNGTKPAAAKSGRQPAKGQQRGGRAVRAPQPPSWRRSLRRAAILGAIVFVFFSFAGGKGNARYALAAELTVMYTVLFVPFTYAIDRFAYRRWQARQAGAPPTKKR